VVREPKQGKGQMGPQETIVYPAEGLYEGVTGQGGAEGEEELESRHVIANDRKVLPAQPNC
jgi:hypothetical protein